MYSCKRNDPEPSEGYLQEWLEEKEVIQWYPRGIEMYDRIHRVLMREYRKLHKADPDEAEKFWTKAELTVKMVLARWTEDRWNAALAKLAECEKLTEDEDEENRQILLIQTEEFLRGCHLENLQELVRWIVKWEIHFGLPDIDDKTCSRGDKTRKTSKVPSESEDDDDMERVA